MKKFIVSVFQRIGDLIIKNISMKVESALVVTYIQIHDPQVYGVGGFVVVTVMWLAVVGLRYAEKVTGVVDKVMTSVKG
jgi:hypothetical protein